MASLPARLVVRHGPTPNQEHTLVLSTNIIGREPINDVVFPDAEISRRHARIVLQNHSYYIEDLGSTNGTFVNGRRIHAITKLGNGDIIDLGESVRLTFVREEGGTADLAPAGVSPAPPTAVNPRAYEPAPPAAEAPPPAPAVYENHQANRRNMYLAISLGAVLVLLCSCAIIYIAISQFAPDLLSGLGG